MKRKFNAFKTPLLILISDRKLNFGIDHRVFGIWSVLVILGLWIRFKIVFSDQEVVDEIVFVGWNSSWFKDYLVSYIFQVGTEIYPPGSPVMANPPLVPMIAGVIGRLLTSTDHQQVIVNRAVNVGFGIVGAIAAGLACVRHGPVAAAMASAACWLSWPLLVASSLALSEISVAAIFVSLLVYIDYKISSVRGTGAAFVGVILGLGVLCKLSFVPLGLVCLGFFAYRTGVSARSLSYAFKSTFEAIVYCIFIVLVLWPTARSMVAVNQIAQFVFHDRRNMFPSLPIKETFAERFIYNIYIIIAGIPLSEFIILIIIICSLLARFTSIVLKRDIEMPALTAFDASLAGGGLLFIIFISVVVPNPSRHQLVPVYCIIGIVCVRALFMIRSCAFESHKYLSNHFCKLKFWTGPLHVPIRLFSGLVLLWAVEFGYDVWSFKVINATNYSSWTSELTGAWRAVPFEPGFGAFEVAQFVNMITVPGQTLDVGDLTHVVQKYLTQNRKVGRSIEGPRVVTLVGQDRSDVPKGSIDSQLIESIRVGRHEFVNFEWVGLGGPINVQRIKWKPFNQKSHNGVSSAFATSNESGFDFFVSSLMPEMNASWFITSEEYDCDYKVVFGLRGVSANTVSRLQVVDAFNHNMIKEDDFTDNAIRNGVSLLINCVDANVKRVALRVAVSAQYYRHGRLMGEGLISQY